jgi:hypothetical protein
MPCEAPVIMVYPSGLVVITVDPSVFHANAQFGRGLSVDRELALFEAGRMHCMSMIVRDSIAFEGHAEQVGL